MREAAREFHVNHRTVQIWVKRAKGKRLDQVDWSDRPRGGRREKASTPSKIEDLIIRVRERLKDFDPLGEFGAKAIHQELQRGGVKPIPSIRTIGRVLLRRGVLDGKKRIRRPAPKPGWYVPKVAEQKMELESFDFVEGLVIRGGQEVMAFNAITLHGGFCSTWIQSSWTSEKTVKTLISHWQKEGIPGFAQFDNDTIFHGPHHVADCFGKVVRLCLQLGVVPVFTPPRETGFQAAIESYNGRWQSKVWHRFQHENISALRNRSEKYVIAARNKKSSRQDAAPSRKSFPKNWSINHRRVPRGQVIYLRRTNALGEIEMLGRKFKVDPNWPHRLVRAELDLLKEEIRFFRLRRRDPDQQPLIKKIPYAPPKGLVSG